MGPAPSLRIALALLFLILPHQAYSGTKCVVHALHALLEMPVAKLHWEKPKTFPDIDLKKQKAIMDRMKVLAEIPPFFQKNQCHHTCWASATATHFENLAQKVGINEKVSPNYLVAIQYLRDTQNQLFPNVERDPLIPGGYFEKALKLSDLYGILPESDYPSSPNVDTYKLGQSLDQLIDAFRAVASAPDMSAEKVSELHARTMDKAKKMIEATFGEFPDPEFHKAFEFQRSVLRPRGNPLKKITFSSEYEDTFPHAMVLRALRMGYAPILSYEHLDDLYVADEGRYLAPEKRPLISDESYHVVIMRGVLTDPVTKTVYYLGQNSHENAPDLLIPIRYLSSGYFYVDLTYLESDHFRLTRSR